LIDILGAAFASYIFAAVGFRGAQPLSTSRGPPDVSTNILTLNRVCPCCDESVPPQGTFCSHCGERLVHEPAPEQVVVPLAELFDKLPGEQVAPSLARGAAIIVSAAVALFLVDRFLAAQGAQWGLGLGAGLAIATLAAQWLAAMQVAYARHDDHPWHDLRDVFHEMPSAAALVALPLCLAWGVVGPLEPAHRYMLGSRAAIALTWTPMAACAMLSAFACAHYVRVQNWRGVLSARELVQTLTQCGIGSLAVVLCVGLGMVLWVPLALAAGVYAARLFWHDEGAVEQHEHAGDVRGVAQVVAMHMSARTFRQWAEGDDKEPRGRVGVAAVTFVAAAGAALLVLPYCLVVVVGRLAATACSGCKIRFWPRAADEENKQANAQLAS